MTKRLWAGFFGGVFLSSVLSAHAQCPDWSALGVGVGGPVRALTTWDDGSGPALWAGGSFSTAGGAPAQNVARWDGASWSALVPGPSSAVQALCVFDDGTGAVLVVAGGFSMVGGVQMNAIARWDGTSWAPFGSGLLGVVDALAVFDAGSGPELHAGGTFPGGIARWDGASWASVGGGVSGFFPWVNSLYVFDDGSGEALYVGGSFFQAGGVIGPNILRWDGSSWSEVGTTDVGDTVLAMTSFADADGPALYVGGTFTTPGTGVARWDGSAWSAVGDGVPGGFVAALAAFHDADGPALYGGSSDAPFLPAGELVARWDGAQWSALPAGGLGGIPRYVSALASHSDGSAPPALAIGGSFATLGGTSVNHVALLEGPCTDNEPFCYGTDALCPCANGGRGGTGCDNPQATGGVRLEVRDFAPDGAGAGTATLLGTGFPITTAPTVVLIRGAFSAAPPTVLGDGLLCASASGIVRVRAGPASGGAVSFSVSHGAGAGELAYQLWYRSNPASFCDTSAAYNLSNGYRLAW